MSEQELNRIFAKNLTRFIEKRGLTQVAVADYVGVSEAAVSKWCKGENSPRMSKVDKLCELLRCNRAALMAENGPELLEQNDITQMLEDLYDKDRTLMQELSGMTPEELAEIRDFAAFVKSKR